MCVVERSAFGLNALLGITRRLSLEGKHSKQDDPDGCDQIERMWHVVNNWRKRSSQLIGPLTAGALKSGYSQARTKEKCDWASNCNGLPNIHNKLTDKISIACLYPNGKTA